MVLIPRPPLIPYLRSYTVGLVDFTSFLKLRWVVTGHPRCVKQVHSDEQHGWDRNRRGKEEGALFRLVV